MCNFVAELIKVPASAQSMADARNVSKTFELQEVGTSNGLSFYKFSYEQEMGRVET
jgi:hypothetical protein